MKKILVTGANGNLGKAVVSHFSGKPFEILLASSTSGASQYHLDFNLVSTLDLQDIDILIHVARSKNAPSLENEIEFLRGVIAVGTQVVSIGSLSEYLIDRSRYGEYKSRVSQFVLESKGIVLTCGLIYGENFKGQLHKIRRVLMWLPFLPQLKSVCFQFTTNLESILQALEMAVEDRLNDNHLLVVDSKTPTEFNVILENLSFKKCPKVFISTKAVSFGALVMERMNVNYFTRDSLKGLIGLYDYPRIQELKIFANFN
jgi:hypothetical protein